MESFGSHDINFSKDEIVDGAVYRIDLKKIRYDSSFNQSEHFEGSKARLRWKLEERKALKMGTLPKLVESICLSSGELDTIFLDVLLTTYLSFTTSGQLLNAIIQWFENLNQIGTSSKVENCKRSIKHAFLAWMAKFEIDFHEPPLFPTLLQLRSFASEHFPGSDLHAAVEEKVNALVKSDSHNELELRSGSILDLIGDISSRHQPVLIPPLDVFIIPSSYFAEQLTYIDAKLFCSVVPRHCLGSIWSRRGDRKLPCASRPDSVLSTIEHFNAVSYRVISTVLKWPYGSMSCRVAVVEKWITVAQECRRLKNFSSLKAILAGLQSNPIFRLKRVWQGLSKEKLDTFKELATIFSEDNNQALWREILSKEGTAKNSDSESISVVSKATNSRISVGSKLVALFSSGNKNKFVNTDIAATTRTMPVVQGTVPYLGTFLTDLTMLDTAFPDVDVDSSMINFEKKRREFEVLAQIQMLQSACNFYRIEPDPAFLDWFYGIRTYDENESHELSLEIEPSQDTISKGKGHKKNMSLGYFTVKRHNLVIDDLGNGDAEVDSVDRRSTQSLKEMSALSKILSAQVDTLSFISTRTTVSDLTHHRRSTPNLTGVASSSGGLYSDHLLQAKVELVCDRSHSTNFYKSILVTNQDHVSGVMKKIFGKFSISGANPEEYYLCQRIENGREIELPEKGNLFYAIKTSAEVRIIVRKKGQGRPKSKSKPRGVSAAPWNREGKDAPTVGQNRLTRLFNSMVSLVPS